MHTRRAILCLIALLGFTLACGPISLLNRVSTPTPASARPVQPTSADTGLTPVSPQGSQASIADLVTGTASLRSAKFHLSTTRPDGQTIQIEAEIDETGSQHVVKTYPASPNALFENGIPNPPTNVEFWVVNGVTYSPDEEGALQPSEEDMTGFLRTALEGADGPAFWLKVLPAGSISAVGDETYGQFEARKYSIQAALEGEMITGMAWLEPSIPALVGATLTIPAKLASSQTEGSLQIDYQLEKADVAPITVDLTSSEPTAAASGPGGLQAYTDARNIVSQPGVFMYDTDADLGTLKQFYLDQFAAGGWQRAGSASEISGVYIANWSKGSISINLAITTNQPSGCLVVITCEGCQ